MKTVIGIPTYKRPQGLATLLTSLAKQKGVSNVHVVVADNEGKGGQGHAVVKQLAPTFPFPLTVIAVAQRGISQARNALLKQAFVTLKADALAMLDDDEHADENWLQQLLAMQKQTGADVVGGYVPPHFPNGAPAWAQGQKVYVRRRFPPGPIPMVEGTTSVLLMRSVHTRFRQTFNPAYSLTGGGDTEFFMRLKQQGATFAYASAALSYEHFTANRLTRSWAIRRSFRIGSGGMRIFLTHGLSLPQWGLEGAKLIAALALALFNMLVFCWHPQRFMAAVLLAARQLGKLSAFFGVHYQEYRQTHGS